MEKLKYGKDSKELALTVIKMLIPYKVWGFGEKKTVSMNLDGHECTNIRIEQAYKGNYHLLADVDGKERKFVISKSRDEYATIQQTGLANLSEELLKSLVQKYLFRHEES